MIIDIGTNGEVVIGNNNSILTASCAAGGAYEGYQLIIAKAGLRSDQDLLIKYYGTSLDKVPKIYLAGAFGNYMDIENAMIIDLLPKTDKNKFVRFGNGALAGARDMLLPKKRRNDAEFLKTFIEHNKPNEVEGEKFLYTVADNMYFS